MKFREMIVYSPSHPSTQATIVYSADKRSLVVVRGCVAVARARVARPARAREEESRQWLEDVTSAAACGGGKSPALQRASVVSVSHGRHPAFVVACISEQSAEF